MSNQLFRVVLTESETGAQDWQVRAVATPVEVTLGAAPLGRATVYIAVPVAARDARDARAHALEIFAAEGLRGAPPVAEPLPRRYRRR